MKSYVLTLVIWLSAGCDGLATNRCDDTADTTCGQIIEDRVIPDLSFNGLQRVLQDGSIGFVGRIDLNDERVIGLLDPLGAVRWATPLEGFYPFWWVDFDSDGAAAGVLYGSRTSSTDPIFHGVLFDASGVQVWRTSIPPPPPTFLSGKVAHVGQDGIAVAAVFGEAGTIQGMTLLTRLGADGAVMWQTTLDFTLAWFHAIPDGGYQVLAYCDDFQPCLVELAEDGAEISRRTLDVMLFNPVPTADGGLVGSLDSFGLARISVDGELDWMHEFNMGDCDTNDPEVGCSNGQPGHVESVALGPEESIWAGLRFTDGADIGLGPLEGGDSLVRGVSIARFDVQGDNLWSRKIDLDCTHDIASPVAVTPSGEASYYCGSSADEPAFAWHLLRLSP